MLRVPALLLLLSCRGADVAPEGGADPVGDDGADEGAAVVAELPPPTDGNRPNILVLDIDSWRADRLLAERDGEPLSPSLVAFAASATRFTKAYAQSGWTLPSVNALLSGRYPRTSGLVSAGNTAHGALPERTLLDVLPLYGYTTAVAWGFTLPGSHRVLSDAFGRRLEAPVGSEDPLTDPVVAFLREPRTAPFFLYVHAMDLHFPRPLPDEAELGRWAPPYAHAALPQLHELQNALIPLIGRTPALEHTVSHYDGTIASYDASVARILATLDDTGLAKNTFVVVTSDHGEELGEHGLAGHGNHYESVLHIPLVIRDPAMAGPRTIDSTVQTVDLAPTLLERAGIPADVGMDGTSYLPLLRGGEPWGERDVYSMSTLGTASLRTARWKLMTRPGVCPSTQKAAAATPTCEELYDLVEDPLEARNLAADHPTERAELDARLRAWMAQRVDDNATREADPALSEALREGGYWGLVAEGAPGQTTSGPPPAGAPPGPPPNGAPPGPPPNGVGPVGPPLGPANGARGPATGALAPADGAKGPPLP